MLIINTVLFFVWNKILPKILPKALLKIIGFKTNHNKEYEENKIPTEEEIPEQKINENKDQGENGENDLFG